MSSENKTTPFDKATEAQSVKHPRVLFHVTTGKMVNAYRQMGKINSPVRGFDSLQGAMAWAMKVGRKVILRVECVTDVHMLPDHHNEWGKAWWTGEVPIERVRRAYSADGAWPQEGAWTNE